MYGSPNGKWEKCQYMQKKCEVLFYLAMTNAHECWNLTVITLYLDWLWRMLTEDTINSGKNVSISAEFGIQIYLLLWRNASLGNSVPQFGNHSSALN
jgi:hypothetical protein